ncbi:hypothetical protein B0A49_13197 [Cryomyces minteri]|uniref:DUF6594 domain-containing protein n=2 Tax=Cryomyces minteri TaxID=331657 RepID=A0A4U0VFB4_9PEZI|nr:hypothetical protein B0A49_13197 [Cryomyces minteri]
MQAQLMQLETDLLEEAREDRGSNEPLRTAHDRSWKNMSPEADAAQWAKINEIEQLLPKYNASLLQLAQLESLSVPTKQNLKSLRNWLERPAYGNGFLIGGPEPWTAGQMQHRGIDYMTLSYIKERDFITTRVMRILPHLKRSITSRHGTDDTIYEMDEKRLLRVADGFVTIISSVIPTLAILMLHFIPPQYHATRLGTIIVFATVFATALFLTAQARRVEVFAATAA